MSVIPEFVGVLAERWRITVIIDRLAAQRRGVAKFHALLRTGRNRKKPSMEIALLSGRRWGIIDLAGETAVIIRRLIVPLTVAVIAVHSGHALAQGAFPAPLPGQGPVKNDSVFPPVNGAAPSAS